MFKSGQINDLRVKLVNVGRLMSSVGPVKEYLTNSGQAQLATQCAQNEGELNQALSLLVNLSVTALEHLAKYGSVCVNYPSDHIEKHRLSKHLAAYQSLYQELTLDK